MIMRDSDGRFPEEFRREVFKALAGAQDRGERPEASCATAAGQFGVTVEEVWRIEREGVENDWPPRWGRRG